MVAHRLHTIILKAKNWIGLKITTPAGLTLLRQCQQASGNIATDDELAVVLAPHLSSNGQDKEGKEGKKN